MVGLEMRRSAEPVDLLGELASNAACRLSKQRAQRQRPGQRASGAAGAVVKRISVAELRARGVDEAFLAPAPCVEDAPVQEKPSDGSVLFVSSKVSAAETAQEVHGARASEPSTTSAAHSFNLGGPGQRATEEAVSGQGSRERHWSSAELQAEYGVGYKLLAGMGYQAGAGRVPLMAVKRQHRAALQDDEAAVLDHSFATSKRPRRARARRSLTQRCDPMIDASASMAEGAVATVEALWAQGAEYEGAASEFQDGSEHEISEDTGSTSDDENDGSLRSAILSEVRQRAGEHMPLAVLVSRPRIRQALADRPECGKRLKSYIQTYIEEHVHECHVRRSLAPGWLKLSSSSSLVSWGEVTRKELVVALRKHGEDQESTDEGGSWHCRDSSSDDQHASSSSKTPLDSAAALEQSQQESQIWSCHSCKEVFPKRVALRAHLQERLIARTTHDPTDLTAPLDAEHRDREALELAARMNNQQQVANRSATGQSADTLVWHCPACRWSCPASHEVSALLVHACSAPAQRVAHQRLIALMAELLIAEPPPPPCPGRRASSSRVVPSRLESWAASTVGIARFFNSLACSSNEGYRQLEAEMLGPLEEDMFSPAVHQESQPSEPQVEEEGIFI